MRRDCRSRKWNRVLCRGRRQECAPQPLKSIVTQVLTPYLALVEDAENPETAHKASKFFQKECVLQAGIAICSHDLRRFQLDLQIASLNVPYVAIMDGFTSQSNPIILLHLLILLQWAVV